MNYLLKIKEFLRFQDKIKHEFEIKDKFTEQIESNTKIEIETQKKVVSDEEKAHMLKTQVHRELYRNQMQRFP